MNANDVHVRERKMTSESEKMMIQADTDTERRSSSSSNNNNNNNNNRCLHCHNPWIVSPSHPDPDPALFEALEDALAVEVFESRVMRTAAMTFMVEKML